MLRQSELTRSPVEGEDREDHDADQSTTARLSSRDGRSRSIRAELLIDGDGRESPVDRVDRLEQRADQRDNVDGLVFLWKRTKERRELTRYGTVMGDSLAMRSTKRRSCFERGMRLLIGKYEMTAMTAN